MSHDVFISYSSKDKAIADSVVAAVEQNGIRCWYAPRDIKPGDDWGKAITAAIEECRVFVVIFSSYANRSQRVLDEVNLAITQQATIIPFRIEDLEPDGAMKLHLSSRHWLDAYNPSWEPFLENLIKNIAALIGSKLGENEVMLPDGIGRAIRDRKPKKTKQMIIAVVIGALLIVTGWYGFSQLLGVKTPETEFYKSFQATTTLPLANENSPEPTLDGNTSASIDTNYPLLGDGIVPISVLGKSIPWLPSTYLKGIQVSKFISINKEIQPLDDPLVRSALSMAIDREKIVELANGNRECYGEVSPATTLIPPEILSRDLYSIVGLNYYPATAKYYMQQAGFPDGEAFPILNMVVVSCEQEVMMAIKSMWEEHLGIQVNTFTMDDYSNWNEFLISNTPAFTIEGAGFEFADPYDFYNSLLEEVDFTTNENLKSLINQAASLVEKPEDRLRLYIEVERIEAEEEVDMIPLFFQKFSP